MSKQFKKGQSYDPSFEKLSGKDLLDNLKAIAHSSDNISYSVQLTEEQIQAKERLYTQNGIQINELEVEKKRINDEFNGSIKTIKATSAELAKAVKFKSEQRQGDVFNVEDPENQEMAVFDEQGICIEIRPFTAGERQRVIKIAN